MIASLGLAIRGGAAEAAKVPVFVGVGQNTVDFLAVNQRVVPTRERPRYYVAEHRTKPGAAAAPEWVVQWVASYLADKGYAVASGFTPPLRLVFEWGQVDPQIGHIGRPIQRVDPAGRKVLPWKETNYDRGRTTPFCVVSAFEADAPKGLRNGGKIWESELWMVLVRPRPQDEVRVGELEVVGGGSAGASGPRAKK